MKSFVRWVATGFGVGKSPILPGTIGTLWVIPLAWMVMQIPAVELQIAVCIAFCFIAIPLCERAEALLGKGKDPGCIVADEYLTLPLVYLGLPFTPWVIASGFLLHRFFDIIKPPPIRQLQNLKGGIGIVMDDVFAALAALACNHLLFWSVMALSK
jgi:phosphatidylglycerophosphatase A